MKTKCSLNFSGFSKRSMLETYISGTVQCGSLNNLRTSILFLEVGEEGIRRGTKTEMSRPLPVREATEEKQEFISEDSDQPSH